MKKFLLIIAILNLQTTVLASECTDYLSALYSKNYNNTIKVTTDKTEFTDKYEDYINNEFISSIVYGKAYLKFPDKRRKKITYFCMMKDYKNITWGYILPR